MRLGIAFPISVIEYCVLFGNMPPFKLRSNAFKAGANVNSPYTKTQFSDDNYMFALCVCVRAVQHAFIP